MYIVCAPCTCKHPCLDTKGAFLTRVTSVWTMTQTTWPLTKDWPGKFRASVDKQMHALLSTSTIHWVWGATVFWFEKTSVKRPTMLSKLFIYILVVFEYFWQLHCIRYMYICTCKIILDQVQLLNPWYSRKTYKIVLFFSILTIAW